jgi:hypothetical protein
LIAADSAFCCRLDEHSLREVARYLGWRLAEEFQWRELDVSDQHSTYGTKVIVHRQLNITDPPQGTDPGPAGWDGCWSDNPAARHPIVHGKPTSTPDKGGS